MQDSVKEYLSIPEADRGKMSAFAIIKGLPESTFRKHATSSDNRRKITNGQGRPSIVSKRNTEFLIQHTIRADRENNGSTLTKVVAEMLQELQGIGPTQARNFVARTFKEKSKGRLKPKPVKAQKRRKSKRLNSCPKMKRPAIYPGTKQRKFTSIDMVQFVNGVFPVMPGLESNKSDNSTTRKIKDSYSTGANVPRRFTLKQIEHRVEKGTLDSICKLLNGIRVSRRDNTPFHLWTNTDGSTVQNTPIHTDRYPTLLSIVGGTGYKKVYLMNNPDNNAKQIQDGIGTVWNKVKESGGNVQWNPQSSERSWYELMEDNVDAGIVLCYTLAKGDALLIPKGCLHGVLTVGVSSMLSISVEEIV
jgi:hypothetical protein